MRSHVTTVVLVFMSLIILSCSTNEDENLLTSIKISGGNFQSGFHGENLDELQVTLLNQDNLPLKDVEVEFRLLDSTGMSSATDIKLGSTMATSDENGIAKTSLTIGTKSGMAIIEAQDKNHLLPPVIFRAFAYHEVDDTHKPLCILEINDFHMRLLPLQKGSLSIGGIARIATIFKEIRKNNDKKGIPTLIVNSGDDFENTFFHNIDNGISTLYQIYDSIGVDVIQVGNHDYHFGIPLLETEITKAEAKFTGALQGHKPLFLWGNVDPSTLFDDYKKYATSFEVNFANTDNSARYNQTILTEMKGIKLGIIGLATDASVYTQVAGNPGFYQLVGAPMDYSEGLTFFNPDPREDTYIGDAIDNVANDEADMIIVASHAGLGFGDRVNIPPGKDELVARHGIGTKSGRVVDLILSAHSHVQLNHAINVENPLSGKTPLVQAKEAGEFVGFLSYEVDITNNKPALTDYHLIQVDSTIEEDKDIAAIVDELKSDIVSKYGNVFENELGVSNVELSHRSKAQSGLGQILADAFKWKLNKENLPCDSAMLIPSIYRADLQKGKITENDVYDIVPLHVLDDNGRNDEPIVILQFTPGLYDFSILGNEASEMKNITAVEYILEAIYSLTEVMEQIQKGASDQLNLEVVQLSNMSYQLDSTAPIFKRIKRDSIKFDGKPIDKDKTYSLAIIHSVGSNLAYILNEIITMVDENGSKRNKALIIQNDGKPYIDSEIEGWVALKDYIKEHYKNDGKVPDNALVTGDRFRTVEPDLTVNPSEILSDVEVPVRGSTVKLTAKIRNLGDAPVSSAKVKFFYESTPWDLTDDDDGRLELEGFDKDFIGSLKLIGEQTVSVEAYPKTKDASIEWEIPKELAPYNYPIVVVITDVQSDTVNPHTGEKYEETILGNNYGPDQSMKLKIVAEEL